MKASLKKWIRAASNFIALIPSRSIRQMLTFFVLELNSKRLYRSSGKKKRKSSSCVHVLHKTWHQVFSRRSRAVTAKKCTKKPDARAELLFCQEWKPIDFCRSHWRRRRRLQNQSLISWTDVIQLTLTLKVVGTSVTVNINSSCIQDYLHPDDHTQSRYLFPITSRSLRLTDKNIL